MKLRCPSVKIVLKSKLPNRKPYPKELKTIGDHLRKKRLDLNLSQFQVVKIINTSTNTLTNWELNKTNPQKLYLKRITLFLEYYTV